ncbi:MAG: hypothetical protein ACI87W_001830 [Halieaceae bacterium]|jgi:hypothetical protein
MTADVDTLPSTDELLDERADSRPDFMGDISGDRVLDAVMRLAMEVCVLRDKMDAYEGATEAADASFRERVETFQASPELEAERMERRRTLIRRLLRDLR